MKTKATGRQVIACGAAVAYVDHQPGEATSYDKDFQAIKKLFAGKNKESKGYRAPSATLQYKHA